MIRKMVFGLLGAGVLGMVAMPVVAIAAPASTAVTQRLVVSPTHVVAGQTVHVSGSCEPNTSGFVLSTAFFHDPQHDFAGVGAVPFNTNASGEFSGSTFVPARTKPGTYAVSARCGGGVLAVSATLHVTAPGAGLPATGAPDVALGVAAATTIAVGVGLLWLGARAGRRSRTGL